MDTFKIISVGDSGVGKTTLLRCHLYGEFKKQYDATLGVEVHPLTFHTNYGPIKFNIWDCAGQEKFGGRLDGYYTGAHGVIVMFDLTNRLSYKDVNNWIKSIDNKLGYSIPTVICGNKVDIEDQKVSQEEISKDLTAMGPFVYYNTSAKSNHNYEKPFLYLARQLTGHKDLNFVEAPAESEEKEESEESEESGYCIAM